MLNDKLRITTLFLCLLFISCGDVLSNPIKSKNHYLINTIDTNRLAKPDKILLDSCLKSYHRSTNTYQQIKALEPVCNLLMDNSWKDYQQHQLQLMETLIETEPHYTDSIAFAKMQISANTNMGIIHSENASKALLYHEKALELANTIGDAMGKATILNNMGFLYKRQGDIVKALELYEASLQIRQQEKDTNGIALALNNIARIYDSQGESDQAIKFYKRAIELHEQMKDKQGIARSLNNIAIVYENNNNPLLALKNYRKSLSLYKAIGDIEGQGRGNNNIGLLHRKNNQIDSALLYYHRSLLLFEQTNQQIDIALCMNNLSEIDMIQGNLAAALQKSQKSLEIALKIGEPNQLKYSSIRLKEIYEKLGKYKEALEMYELSIQMRDSLKNEATQKATIRQQTKYEFEKAQLIAQQQKNEELRIQKETLERRNNLQYSVIFIAILAVFGGVLTLGKINVSPKFAEGLVFFAFLLLFEFLLVLTDPYVDKLTQGEPIYKLLINALLAGFIFPLHSFFEATLKTRLLRRNNI